MNSLKNKLIYEFSNIVRLISNKPYFGFVNGHSYVSKDETRQMLKLINNSNEVNDKLTENFENEFANLIGNGKAVSFAAGRMAFYSYMKILKIGKGDEVIIQASNCGVMINAILRIGATPIFADVDINTMGTDPDSVLKMISSRTKLIVAQHSFGIPCEIDRIMKIAKEHKIKVLEDCALSVGSKYNNKILGEWGDAALFSIDHSKPLNCMIGGLLYLNNESYFQKIKKFRDKIPNLNKKHQLSLYKQFLFERKYYNPNKYSLAKIFEFLVRIFNKIIKPQIVFLTDDYCHPDKLEKANYPFPAKLPVFISQLGMYELKNFEKNKRNRIKLLKEFVEIFIKNDKLELLPKAYFDKKIKLFH